MDRLLNQSMESVEESSMKAALPLQVLMKAALP
jgi:hypothetical protein